MLQKLKQQISQLRAKGATYADVRWYPNENHNVLVMHNGNLRRLVPARNPARAFVCFTKVRGAFLPLLTWRISIRFLIKRLIMLKLLLSGLLFPFDWQKRMLFKTALPVLIKLIPLKYPWAKKWTFSEDLTRLWINRA